MDLHSQLNDQKHTYQPNVSIYVLMTLCFTLGLVELISVVVVWLNSIIAV